MAKKIKRGFLIKRYYCGNCNARVKENDSVCQKCGQPLESIPKNGRAAAKQKPLKKPVEAEPLFTEEQLEEEPLEEQDEEQSENDLAEQEMEDYAEPGFEDRPLRKTALFASPFRTILWLVVGVLLLWGLFASDTSLLVAAVLVLVLVELEAIRRRIGN